MKGASWLLPVAIALLTGGCAYTPSPATEGSPGPGTSVSANAPGCLPVTISGHTWPTGELNLRRGECVEFTNLDFMNHRFTDPAAGIDSGDFFRKDRWTYPFNRSGTFALEILKHPGRVMTVAVE